MGTPPVTSSTPPPPSKVSTPPLNGPPATCSPATRAATLGGSSSLARSSSLPRNGLPAGSSKTQGASGLARAGSAGASSVSLGIKRELNADKPAEGTQTEVNGHHIDIDKIIQMATSHSPRPPSSQPLAPSSSGGPPRSGTPSNSQQPPFTHPGPGQDTRMCLFVGNLPFRVRWQDVKDLFRRAGTVLRADVSLGSDNRSRGHGTVLMGSREDGIRAVDMFNGYNWQTRVLEVRPDRLPPEFEQHAPPQQQHPNQQHHPQQMPHFQPSPLHPHPHSHPMGLAFGHPGPGPRSGSPFYNNGPPPPNGFHHGPPPPHPHPLSGPPASGPPASSPGSSQGLLVPASVLAATAVHGTPPTTSSATQSTPTATTSALPTPPLSTSSTSTHITPTIASSSIASNAQLRNSSKSPGEAGHRAPPPPPLGALPPPPAFGQVGHSMQPAYSQQHQQPNVSPSAGLKQGGGGVAGRVLFVGNLPYHIQWQDLKDLFRPAGNIIRADVVLGPDGRSKGIGHVLFASEEDAARGIQKYSGHELNGRVLQVRLETNVGQPPGPQPPQSRQPLPPQQQMYQQQGYPQQQQQQQQQRQQPYPMPMPSPHHQPPPMNFPLYGYEPPSPFHPPPSPFYPPPSPFHAPFQPPKYLHQNMNGGSASAAKPGEASATGGGAAGDSQRAQHPHPGPISLPPAYAGFGGGVSGGGASPMLSRSAGGLPMMTPSMPSFQFGAPFNIPQTPEYYPHAFLSPGLGPLSPDPNSPNPNNSFNRTQQQSFAFHRGGPGGYNPAPGARPQLTPLMMQDNPMFPPSPTQHYRNGSAGGYARMETPGQVYFPQGAMIGHGAGGFGALAEEAGRGEKTPPAGKSTGGSAGRGGEPGAYPFPALDAGEEAAGEGEGEMEELVDVLEEVGIEEKKDAAPAVRSRRNSGGGA